MCHQHVSAKTCWVNRWSIAFCLFEVDYIPKSMPILYYFDQIGSHAPLSITNFGRGRASLRPLSNLQAVTQALKMPKKRQKDIYLRENVEILRGVTLCQDLYLNVE
jgi:hypothetical protein